MQGKKKIVLACLSALGLMLTAVSASRAAVVVTLTSDHAPTGGSGAYTPPAAFTPSTNDLLTGMIGSLAYVHSSTGLPSTGDNGVAESCRGPAAWTDGSVATTYATGTNSVDHAAYGTVDGYNGGNDTKTYLTYNLGSLYNLTSADIFTGWNDSGRDSSSFTLQSSTDGINFNNIAVFTKGPDDTGVYKTPVTNKVDIIDNTGASLGTAQYVRLYFTDADNGYAGLSEVVVAGTPASVPEPASLGIMALAGLAALRRRPQMI